MEWSAVLIVRMRKSIKLAVPNECGRESRLSELEEGWREEKRERANESGEEWEEELVEGWRRRRWWW